MVPADVKRYFGIGRYFYAASMDELARSMDDDRMIAYWSSERDRLRDTCGDLSEYTVLIDGVLAR